MKNGEKINEILFLVLSKASRINGEKISLKLSSGKNQLEMHKTCAMPAQCMKDKGNMRRIKKKFSRYVRKSDTEKLKEQIKIKLQENRT